MTQHDWECDNLPPKLSPKMHMNFVDFFCSHSKVSIFKTVQQNAIFEIKVLLCHAASIEINEKFRTFIKYHYQSK